MIAPVPVENSGNWLELEPGQKEIGGKTRAWRSTLRWMMSESCSGSGNSGPGPGPPGELWLTWLCVGVLMNNCFLCAPCVAPDD